MATNLVQAELFNESDTLLEARDKREILQTQLETVRMSRELQQLQTETLVEGYRDNWQPVRVPWDDYPYFDEPNFYGGNVTPTPYTTLEDRTEGRWRPVYETEQDLATQRMQARRCSNLFASGTSVAESLVNYTIGKGFTFTVEVEDEDATSVDSKVERFVQKQVNTLLKSNKFIANLDREIHDRAREDGECFIAIRPTDSGVTFQIIEPDQITEPGAPRQIEDWLIDQGKIPDLPCNWHFGVLTQSDPVTNSDNTAKPLGYHVIYDSSHGDWDFIPAEQMVHIKRNVYRNAKRGVSDYYGVIKWLEKNERLMENTASGASVQAAIALIREHQPGVTKSDMTTLITENSNRQIRERTATGGNRTKQVQNWSPGTIVDMPQGKKYHPGPMGSPSGPQFIPISQALYRGAGVRWNMPEYMASGDASNGNFASTLVAESPFVKSRESDQIEFGEAFVELIWKALHILCEVHKRFEPIGLCVDQLKLLLDIAYDPPEVASRDKAQQAATDQTLNALKVKSKRTIAGEHGLDYDQEMQNMEGEPQAEGGGEAPGGMPAPVGGGLSESLLEDNCGTGHGGFKSGNSCAGENGDSTSQKSSNLDDPAFKYDGEERKEALKRQDSAASALEDIGSIVDEDPLNTPANNEELENVLSPEHLNEIIPVHDRHDPEFSESALAGGLKKAQAAVESKFQEAKEFWASEFQNNVQGDVDDFKDMLDSEGALTDEVSAQIDRVAKRYNNQMKLKIRSDFNATNEAISRIQDNHQSAQDIGYAGDLVNQIHGENDSYKSAVDIGNEFRSNLKQLAKGLARNTRSLSPEDYDRSLRESAGGGLPESALPFSYNTITEALREDPEAAEILEGMNVDLMESDSLMEQWLDLLEAGEWQGPFDGKRGGKYWISPSGRKSYREPKVRAKSKKTAKKTSKKTKKAKGVTNTPEEVFDSMVSMGLLDDEGNLTEEGQRVRERVLAKRKAKDAEATAKTEPKPTAKKKATKKKAKATDKKAEAERNKGSHIDENGVRRWKLKNGEVSPFPPEDRDENGRFNRSEKPISQERVERRQKALAGDGFDSEQTARDAADFVFRVNAEEYDFITQGKTDPTIKARLMHGDREFYSQDGSEGSKMDMIRSWHRQGRWADRTRK